MNADDAAATIDTASISADDAATGENSKAMTDAGEEDPTVAYDPTDISDATDATDPDDLDHDNGNFFHANCFLFAFFLLFFAFVFGFFLYTRLQFNISYMYRCMYVVSIYLIS